MHDDPSVGRSTRMIVRIYTGDDGQTHFEDLSLPAEESHNVALQAGANLVFRRFPADHWSDWHTAPRRQYIFILAGGGAASLVPSAKCCLTHFPGHQQLSPPWSVIKPPQPLSQPAAS